MPYAIKVENLSKQYIINKSGEQYTTLRDRLVNIINLYHGRTGKREKFWALQNIDFQIEPGEVVGIIGSNGAGKSTLLKILSKITPPTCGNVIFNGRTASLLEVGTGFHQELSGRDNIYLNGAILGMDKDEIKKKFNEIVEFSGINKFLDTPVKHYSSGMSVRLAFSIAAHLDPEILLLDEVLSVGDAEFQKRCFTKMQEVVEKSGRTILLVSHNMLSIKNLCSRCIYLKGGKIKEIGNPNYVIDRYLQSDIDMEITSLTDLEKIINGLPDDPVFKLKKIKLWQDSQPVFNNIVNGSPLEILIEYWVRKKTTGLRVYFNLYDNDENLIFRSFHDEDGNGIPSMEPGHYSSTAMIPANLLGPIGYKLRVNAGIHNVRNLLPVGGVSVPLNVRLTSNYNRAYGSDSFMGKLALSIKWETRKL